MCRIPFPPNSLVVGGTQPTPLRSTLRAGDMITPVILLDRNITRRRATHGIPFYPINCTSICRGLFSNEKGLILQTRHGWMSRSPAYETILEFTSDASEKGDVV